MPGNPVRRRVLADLLEAAIQRNPEALKAYRGDGFGAPWFRAVIDLLLAHVLSGGPLLDGLVHILMQEHAAKTRAMREELEALRINTCVHCRQPLPPQVIP